jgi:hypothetical protein
MFPVTRAVFKNKRICQCVEALLRPQLITKILRVVHITLIRVKLLGVRKNKPVQIHILYTVDQDQLQSSNNRAIAMLDLSIREWWEILQFKAVSINQELEVVLIFKLINLKDQVPVK